MAGNYLKITGCLTGKGVDNKWPPRKEFDTFLQDKKQAVLYFLALDKVCHTPITERDSYFQLAGLHGLPKNKPWPRDATDTDHGLQLGEYCAHKRPWFTTFHRAYLLAFEQIMSKIMMDWVGPDSPDSPIPEKSRSEWKVAAETWRLPYWDFALRRSYNQNNACVPEQALIDGDVLSPLATGTAHLPNIPKRDHNPNPLYAFEYPLPKGETPGQHGINEWPYGMPLGIQSRTVRYAPIYNPANRASVDAWKNGTSNVNRLLDVFRTQTAGWRKDLGTFLKESTTFNSFIQSLEAIHDTLHTEIGGYQLVGGFQLGNGNMIVTKSAAFDPIFFIYHAGIDHLTALWQAGHPGTTSSDWMDASADIQELVPFRNENGAYFTSKAVRNWEDWGYSYEDVSKITNHDQLVKRVDELYDDKPKVIKPAAAPGVPTFSPLTPEYVFSCSYPTHAIGPFLLHVYVESDGAQHEVGKIVNFVAPVSSSCDNCNKLREAGNTTTSSTFISEELKELCDQGIIPSFEIDDLELYLAENLKWALYGPEELDIGTAVPSMKIEVSRRDKAYKEGFGDPGDGVRRFPAPGELDYVPPTKVVATVPLRAITAGKPGGLREGEELN